MAVFMLENWCLKSGNPDETPAGREILQECLAVADLLLQKNRAYGNSALEPLRVFSKADSEEQIRVRLDDKLSRLMRGQGKEWEDVEQDIMGYLILLRIARRRESERAFPDPQPVVPVQGDGESDADFLARRAIVAEYDAHRRGGAL